MAIHWGVDSVSPATYEVTVPNEYRIASDPPNLRMSLFDYVQRRMGQGPSFWGRYLNIDVERAARRREEGRYTSQLSPDEIHFLHRNRCKILLVYNGRFSGRGGYRAGEEAAAHATRIAHDLGVPAGTRIYADLENWQVQPAWFRGWFTAMRELPYRCGAYGRPVNVVENPDSTERRYGMQISGFSPYTQRIARQRFAALRQLGVEPRRVMTSEVWSDDLSEALAEYRRETVERVGELTFGAVYTFDFYIWSNMPRRVLRRREHDAVINRADIPNEFAPAGPPTGSNTRVCVWQYLQNALWAAGASRGFVDMNLADDFGYRDMWAP